MNPFTFDKDRTRRQTGTEFGWGRGMFADPVAVAPSMYGVQELPYAPPMQDDQLRMMAEAKRMDVGGGDGLETAQKPDEPSDLTYVAGNPDRHGAQPPLVRDKGMPDYCPEKPYRANKFKRAE